MIGSRRATFRRLFSVLAVVLAIIILTPTAYADDKQYDGTNPHTTGCDNGAFPARSRNVPGGLLELRFSGPPAYCGTAWARFTCQQFQCTNFVLWVHRVNDNKQENIYWTLPAWMMNGQSTYTLQLYDAAAYTAYACIQGYFGAQAYCTSTY
jgi:Protein of unknown function (DUF2690)